MEENYKRKNLKIIIFAVIIHNTRIYRSSECDYHALK